MPFESTSTRSPTLRRSIRTCNPVESFTVAAAGKQALYFFFLILEGCGTIGDGSIDGTGVVVYICVVYGVDDIEGVADMLIDGEDVMLGVTDILADGVDVIEGVMDAVIVGSGVIEGVIDMFVDGTGVVVYRTGMIFFE